MFDSQLYPFVGRSRRLPLRDNNGRCVNQEGKHERHMIINFGQVNTSYLSSFTAIVKCKIMCTGYRRLYLCDRFFEQKMAENKDKNTNRLENNGCYSSISLVSVIQILAST